MSAIDHLHSECMVMPIREHCMMTDKQYVAACHLPVHPGHRLLRAPPKPRIMKRTIISQHGTEVEREYGKPLPSKEDYNRCIKKIHTKAVWESINNAPPNNFINTLPPPINAGKISAEQESENWAGYSCLLNNYLSQIDQDTPDLCPRCQASPHDVHHLFACDRNPTDLEVINLWTRPHLVAEFLNLNND